MAISGVFAKEVSSASPTIEWTTGEFADSLDGDVGTCLANEEEADDTLAILYD